MSTSAGDTQAAIEEAERFLKRAKVWLSEMKSEPNRYDSDPSQARAAMLRSSMDLTHALARLRRRN